MYRWNMSGAQKNYTQPRLSISDRQGAKIAVMCENYPVFGKCNSNELPVRVPIHSRFLYTEHIKSFVAQQGDDIRGNIFICQEGKVSKRHAAIGF